MRTLLRNSLLLFAMLMIISACEKDTLEESLFIEPLPEAATKNFGRDASSTEPILVRTDKDVLTRTKLGKFRDQNPFSLESIRAAYKSLISAGVPTRDIMVAEEDIRTTNLYVKFMPQSHKHMKRLSDLDLLLMDFPLEYEVIEMGDYYHPLDSEELPEFYTVVDADFRFPRVPYEIVTELYLNDFSPLLLAESFRLLGLSDQIDQYVPNIRMDLEDVLVMREDGWGFPEQEPDWPDCPPNCTIKLILDTSRVPYSWYWDCDCTPPPPPPVNECGCTFNANRRHPGGCVRVEDTQLGHEGVRQVKVIGWNGWFKIDFSSTDDNGCWRIYREYSGKAHFWIQFKNDHKKIRGGRRGLRFWEHFWSVRDYVGSVYGPVFNNITTTYGADWDHGTQGHRFWGAAATNNAYEEFNDYAAEIGILGLPNLDIYIADNRRGGFALMTSMLGSDALGDLIASGLYHSDTFGDFDFLDQLYAIGGGLTATGVAGVMPDVMIGTNYLNSDGHRALAFHEFAHASQFALMGPPWWEQLAKAEIIADYDDGHPWGTAESHGAGVIAIAESWAEHIAHLFAHKKYDTNVSGSDNRTFVARLEATRNFALGHIPIGLYLDLFDDGIEPSSRDETGGGDGTVNDEVAGISYSQMFSLFNAALTNPDQYIERLKSFTLPSGVTNSQIDNLWASYQ